MQTPQSASPAKLVRARCRWVDASAVGRLRRMGAGSGSSPSEVRSSSAKRSNVDNMSLGAVMDRRRPADGVSSGSASPACWSLFRSFSACATACASCSPSRPATAATRRFSGGRARLPTTGPNFCFSVNRSHGAISIGFAASRSGGWWTFRTGSLSSKGFNSTASSMSESSSCSSAMRPTTVLPSSSYSRHALNSSNLIDPSPVTSTNPNN
mmetsp:Transcript_33579/g.87307  ORF Transcript_33579/g.87307 Transcript_33579/m.87307 type:complete len:211 (+) Transcript_33579:132-764(+)